MHQLGVRHSKSQDTTFEHLKGMLLKKNYPNLIKYSVEELVTCALKPLTNPNQSFFQKRPTSNLIGRLNFERTNFLDQISFPIAKNTQKGVSNKLMKKLIYDQGEYRFCLQQKIYRTRVKNNFEQQVELLFRRKQDCK